ncbi:MAG TPA: M20/M25/M40 family metallo-hydrolase [Longimicrobium sp.]|nr:M20/M25/M40 family metallo-hydrolase [Longimicrobium sp.]
MRIALALLVALAAPLAGQEAELAADAAYLAADRMGGRAVAGPGNEEAARYIAERFSRLGLAPTFADPRYRGGAACPRGWFQEFPIDPDLLARGMGRNVAARVDGTDPALRGEVVVVGAHLDHVGRGSFGSRGMEGAIHNGADDNASGTAAVLELARRLAARPARRTVLVVAFDAEELGLVGSRHFVDNPPVPIGTVVGMVNLDMVGRLRDDRLTLYGVESAPGLRALAAEAAAGTGLELRPVARSSGASDDAAFARRRIPTIHLFTGRHADYHAGGDDAERINIAGLARITDYAEKLLRAIADRDQRLR